MKSSLSFGAGGMGEVYRARDSRLGRDVAVKVLPSAFATDIDRLQRFEQEARAAAALNHPNILAVHDVGTHDGAPYIVSELLEGEPLRDVLHSGPLPVRKAVEYAVAIAQGLAAAHERGIVHRDLKPENAFVTADGRVKILDFGLAKLTQAEPAVTNVSALPTTPPLPYTIPGMVLGTMGYMPPEQVRGAAADHRGDVFALGALLYEMLSGRRAFGGDTTADTMSSILREDPADLPVAERNIPLALARIVDRCLEKNPAARFQSTRDLAFALEALSTHSGQTAAVGVSRNRARSTQLVALAGAALLLVAATVAGVSYLRPAGQSPAYKMSVLVPPHATGLGRVAVSQDGRHVAFTARTEGRLLLWVRPLDSTSATALSGTEGATAPFWSPDSRSIGFFAQGKLKRISISGGPPQTLCDAPGTGRASGTWNREGVILSNAVYVETVRGGYLLFAREGILLAQAFDTEKLTLTGDPTPAIEEQIIRQVVAGNGTSYASFSVSDAGTLVYREGTRDSQTLSWVDRSGRPIASLGTASGYNHVELSPDGGRVAVDRRDDRTGQTDIWLLDVSTGVPTRFTFTPGRFFLPRWAPDGSRLVFAENNPRPGLLVKPASGAGAEERVFSATDPTTGTYPGDWSSDGQSIVFRNLPPGTQGELWRLSIAGQRQAEPVPQTATRGTNGRFSPDGRWLAYESTEAGRTEVYVQPFPSTGAKWLVSRNGGGKPRWRRDGRELFYVTGEGTLAAVPIGAGETFQAGEPSTLFEVSFTPSSVNSYPYAASADGQRFLVITPEETASTAAISVVLNWAAVLRN